MSESRTLPTPRAQVAHAVPGRLRVRIDAPRGQGKLHRLEDELNRMPDTADVRANHAARSVTVTFNPLQTSPNSLLDRLQEIGLIALNFADPAEWGEALVEEVLPRAEDPATLPGRLNQELLTATAGHLDLFRIAVGLLLLSAGFQVRGALLRGEAIPWLRVTAYLLAATSIWTRRRDRGPVAMSHGARERPILHP
jgi:hypothetical protein